MDSIVEDEKKHDQVLEETTNNFEDEGDQALQETIDKFEDDGDQYPQESIRIKKRPPRCHDDDEGGCVQEKTKRMMKKMMDKARCPSPHATPELPVILRNRIRALGGSDVTFVIQKPLFKTDVSSGHNRLSIPLNQVQQSFLTPEKSESLRKWNMKKASGNSTSMYVLVTNWKSVTERNSMKEDETVQLWSFRIKSKLGFALVKRRLQDDPRNRSLRGILDS
ncbi:B3 domain-containing protein [Vitis vinifera]|uniref:B3 domain-containing protein n=1 Tax=Vitis vinifera TaxID=29760 RepID=A0A438GBR1_VITVI|nr:B3 domain-containing protein [Vitis vinifera]